MSLSDQREFYSWNPETVLNMVNPNKNSATQWTCPVQSSRKTRCLNSRDANSYIGARLILSEMATTDPSIFLHNKDKLVELAKLTLCLGSHRHAYKQIVDRKEKMSCVDIAVAEWIALISNHIRNANERHGPFLIDAGGPKIPSIDYSWSFIEEGLMTPGSSGTSESSTVSGVQRTSQRLGRTGSRPSSVIPASLGINRRHEASPVRRQYQRTSPRASSTANTSPARSSGSGQPSSAVLLQNFRNLTLEYDREKVKSSQIREEYKALQQKLLRTEKDLKATQEQRDDLSDQVDDLYQEINELTDRLEDVQISGVHMI